MRILRCFTLRKVSCFLPATSVSWLGIPETGLAGATRRGAGFCRRGAPMTFLETAAAAHAQCALAFAERTCEMASVRAMLWLLFASLVAAHPTTTSVPVATTPAVREVSCDHAAQSCWSQGQLPLPGGAWGCAEPLSRGPCDAGEWLTLDLSPAPAQSPRSLRGRCVARPCPPAQLPWDGRCVVEDEARVALCGGRALHLDPRGLPRCGDFPGWTSALSALVRCAPGLDTTTVVGVGGVHCAQHDGGDCAKDVVTSTGSVVIEPEDK